MIDSVWQREDRETTFGLNNRYGYAHYMCCQSKIKRTSLLVPHQALTTSRTKLLSHKPFSVMGIVVGEGVHLGGNVHYGQSNLNVGTDRFMYPSLPSISFFG